MFNVIFAVFSARNTDSVGKFHVAQVLFLTVVMLLAIESIYSESVDCGS